MTQPRRKLADLDNPAVTKTYRRLAPIYDKTFGKFADAALRQTIERANQLEGSLLEVGVGTGLALPHYKSELAVTGIDLSPHMLKRARARVSKTGRTNIHSLHEMDATKLDFADRSFDLVFTRQALEQMEMVRDAALHEISRVSDGWTLHGEPFADFNQGQLQRTYVAAKDYFSLPIAQLPRFNLEAVQTTAEYPQNIELGIGVVVARKTR